MANAAVNGLGRIGRATLKILLDTPGLEVKALNDLMPIDDLVYLLRYDTVYGRYSRQVGHDGSDLVIDGKKYTVFSEKDPSRLPWKNLDIDVVFECTGIFTRRDDMQKHLDAGAGRVILSTTSKSEDVPTVVPGVNEADRDARIISCASCTTNCITPVVEIVGRRIGIRKAVMTTIHAYTATQLIVDGPSKKIRRGRAGAANLVPTTTGAAEATTRVLTQYENLFDGSAVRAPVTCGSISNIVLLVTRRTFVDEVNAIFREEAKTDRYRDILGVTDDEWVSSDVIQDPRASIVDSGMTRVVDGDLVKIMSWYDNEWGYSSQMVREARRLSAAGR
ncbi:MAG: glyceraldehyde 3-phosphate dehydrogenase NAD-binding domain-containing protein [Syntrophales bacterium]|nr:glyceraldehyde 3-phosphate dehydrogenase NAD-binding domain-containing protein [Syntrophales bacterium]MDD5533753.1 glyceraldehyde 3-phosphate dehydrogenase NAD-binding domain-containing protein [Syntrophales bacterium]